MEKTILNLYVCAVSLIHAMIPIADALALQMTKNDACQSKRSAQALPKLIVVVAVQT
jgi:hypothetical protein